MPSKRAGRPLAALAVAALLLGSCGRPPENDPRLLVEWMRALYGAIRVERLSPPVASRLVSYSSSALYSGLAAADDGMIPLTKLMNGLSVLPTAEPTGRYDGTLTALAANRVVLDSMLREALPTTRAQVMRLSDSLDAARIALGIGSVVQKDSRELGRRIGLAIVAWSRADGFDSTRRMPPYKPPAGLGLWVNDAPGNTYAAQNQSGATDLIALDNPANTLQAGKASDRSLILSRPKARNATLPAMNIAGVSEPYWGMMRPFVLVKWDECLLPPPPSFSMEKESPFYKEAEEVYRIRQQLTEEQRTTALFWADNAGESGTPVGHWMSIASQIISQRKLSAAEAARILVQTSVAQADAFIASWGYKYRYNLLRPRTYIRAAIDSTWEPAIPTPPFPEYPSGHSTQSSAAATVLKASIGDARFDDSTSITLGHRVRTFESFIAAAEEAGLSRIYAGIHFPSGNIGGRTLGQCIGTKVVDRFNAVDAR
jgi:membrane-associated phospholipid phosphatase